MKKKINEEKSMQIMENVKSRNAVGVSEAIKGLLKTKMLTLIDEARKQVAAVMFAEINEASPAVGMPAKKKSEYRSGTSDYKPGKYGGKKSWESDERMPYPKDYFKVNGVEPRHNASAIAQFSQGVKEDEIVEGGPGSGRKKGPLNVVPSAHKFLTSSGFTHKGHKQTDYEHKNLYAHPNGHKVTTFHEEDGKGFGGRRVREYTPAAAVDNWTWKGKHPSGTKHTGETISSLKKHLMK